MPGKRILILGGTGEARALAPALIEAGFSVVTSLAGVTRQPLLPAGELRCGGFGGAAGLASYLRQEGTALVVDATHPFAAVMSSHAHLACRDAGVPLLRLERAAWQAGAGDRWTPVGSAAEAAAALPEAARALVTIGRKDIAPFLARQDVSGLARMIEHPALPLPSGWTLLCERPPFSVESERLLMRAHGIDCLVSKNAGGSATEAKLVAARELRIPVIMVQRPVKPEVQTFDMPTEVVSAARRLLSP